jgi:endonuclease/exonuclease/phosphatase family metal-dependent hydrolase
LRADIVLPGSAVLHVFNVHLGTSFFERRLQARRLVAADLLTDLSLERPRLVLGDFNEWTSGLATRLLQSHMQSADIRTHLRRSRTYPGMLPLLHLDHIYFDPQLKLEKLTLCRTRKAIVASDHLPLAAEFTVA